MSESNYIPGTCNIGKEEVAYRKQAFIIAVVINLSLFLMNCFIILNFLTMSVLFLVSVFTAINFLQYRNRFCIKYGWFHQFNFGKRGLHQYIDEATYYSADRKKVIEIILWSIAYASIISVLTYIIHSR